MLALPGGRRAAIDTLTRGRRRIELIFLNLPMHTNRRYMAVPALWHDRALELRTHLSAGSPVTRSDTYDYDRLIGVLVGLLRRYRPTVVHTLDPDPDIQLGDEATRKRDSEQRGYADHGDHTAVGCFSWAALSRWVSDAVRDGEPIPAFATTAFRGYYNRHWPKNLPPGVLKEKAAHLVPYGGDPSWECGNPSGCGDYGVGGDRPLTNRKGWVRSTHHRWPGAGPALGEEPDGRLAAYGVIGLRAVRWRESAPGSGAWGEPEDLGGGPLAPALGSAVLGDGRVLLLGVRFAAIEGHGGPNRREVVLLEQRSPGGPFLAWRGLGGRTAGTTGGAGSVPRWRSRPPTAASTSSYGTRTRASRHGSGRRTAPGAHGGRSPAMRRSRTASPSRSTGRAGCTCTRRAGSPYGTGWTGRRTRSRCRSRARRWHRPAGSCTTGGPRPGSCSARRATPVSTGTGAWSPRGRRRSGRCCWARIRAAGSRCGPAPGCVPVRREGRRCRPRSTWARAG